VGVVTPYRDQLDALRRGFLRVTETNPDSSRLAPVEFATVDGVQGREFDVVLFSCVRATANATATASARRDGSRTEKASVRFDDKNAIGFDDDVDDASPADVAAALASRRAIGFLADKRRLNVALTRPRLALVVVGHAATLRAADDTWRSLWEDAERRGVSILSAGSGAEVTRDALFSFRADGTGVLNVAIETSVPEAVVDLAESDDDDEDEEEEMRDDYDDKALAIATSRSRPVSEHLVLPSAVAKRGRVDGAFAAGALFSKRAKPLPPKPAPKPAQARVRSSVPVAPITSVTRSEKKVITTTSGGRNATSSLAAAATARAKATLEAGGRASTARVVAPPAKKKKTNDLVGSILKGMRRE
jgi:senataxin